PPLHFAGTDAAIIALQILMLHCPFENVRDRLETAMRMIRRAFRLAGTMRDRSHAVEQQERIEMIEPRRWKRTGDNHALPFELRLGLDDFCDRTCSDHFP